MKKLWDLKKGFSNLELEGQGHGSDTPTSARAILHYTDQNRQNILKGSVCISQYILIPWSLKKYDIP